MKPLIIWLAVLTIVSCQQQPSTERIAHDEMFRNTRIDRPEVITIDGSEYIQYSANGMTFICPKTKKETHNDKTK